MAITSSSIAASGTPATDMYTALTGLMTTWTHVEQVSAANAGTTDIVEVWRNSTSKVYVLIEVDNTNARLRFRCSEGYDAATHTVIHPCPGVQSNTAQTPNANDSVTGTEDANDVTIFQATGTTSKVGWVEITVSAGGFNYVAGANDDEVILSTSPSRVNWVHAGRVPAADNFTPDTTIVFLGGRATTTLNQNVSWTIVAGTSLGNYRVSREPNQGANALTGAFAAQIDSIQKSNEVAAAWGGQPGTAHKWLTNMVAYQAYLHGGVGSAQNAAIRSHLCKLSSLAVAGHDTHTILETGLAVGDTVTVDGTTYYILGTNTSVISLAGLAVQSRLVLAKDGAF